MSAVAESARVALILADFAAADAINKLNIIGAGWQLAPTLPMTGATAPQTVVVVVEVPPAHYNDDFALSIALVDEAGAVVRVPQPTTWRVSPASRRARSPSGGTIVPRCSPGAARQSMGQSADDPELSGRTDIARQPALLVAGTDRRRTGPTLGGVFLRAWPTSVPCSWLTCLVQPTRRKSCTPRRASRSATAALGAIHNTLALAVATLVAALARPTGPGRA